MNPFDQHVPGQQVAHRQLSLLTPSGHLTLGNYLGALRGMVTAQHESTCFFGISDLHALTSEHDPAKLRALTRETQTLMLACGLSPEHVTLFRQSQVPTHTAMAYLLECTAYVGELNRMIQFRERRKSAAASLSGTRTSLYTYPVLMAADILLYRPAFVPVGEDQRQHVELTRDLALRFNSTYGSVFVVPDVSLPKVAARVMDLADPTRKMSKSTVSSAGVIRLLDDADTVRRKVARAVTDSETGPDAVRHDPATKPGVSNLVAIVAGCTGVAPDSVEAPTYGALKKQATEAVVSVLEPLQERYAELSDDPEHVEGVFRAGAERCLAETAPVLDAARAAIGL